jgi:hypothetical protein
MVTGQLDSMIQCIRDLVSQPKKFWACCLAVLVDRFICKRCLSDVLPVGTTAQEIRCLANKGILHVFNISL